MALPETYRCEAITLSYTPLGEADLLVTMYTRDQGKVRAVAKGARRSTSKLLGHLEPLTVVRMSMVHGRSMDIIAKAEVLQSFAALKEDLTGIAEGLYLAELVDVFGAEGSANPSLFQLIVDTSGPVEADPGSDMPLRFFEFHLFQGEPLAHVWAPGATPLPDTGKPGLAATTLRIRVGEHGYTVEVGELTHSFVEVTVEGETFQVEVAGLPSQTPPPPRTHPNPGHHNPARLPPEAQPAAYRAKIIASPLSGRGIGSIMPFNIQAFQYRGFRGCTQKDSRNRGLRAQPDCKAGYRGQLPQ